jgi:hypothetical protein
MNSHDCAKEITVIQTTLARRGNGQDTPIRIITQYWDKDGTLLAEVDPAATAVTPEVIKNLQESAASKCRNAAEFQNFTAIIDTFFPGFTP